MGNKIKTGSIVFAIISPLIGGCGEFETKKTDTGGDCTYDQHNKVITCIWEVPDGVENGNIHG